MVEVAEIIVHEADEPNVLADLLDADALTGENSAEIDLPPIATGAHAPSPTSASPCRKSGMHHGD